MDRSTRMTKNCLVSFVFGIVILLLSGCATRPPFHSEIAVVGNLPESESTDINVANVLIYNASDPLFFGMNSDLDKMDVTVDGKGVVQLKNGQFAYFPLSYGEHTVDLYHWDIFNFNSTHQITIEPGKTIIEICAVPRGNKARVRGELPETFDSSFTSYDQPRASWLQLMNLPYFSKGFSEERRVHAPGSYFCSW